MRDLPHLSWNLEDAKVAAFQSSMTKLSQTPHEVQVLNNVRRDTTGISGAATALLTLIICLTALSLAWQHSTDMFVLAFLLLTLVKLMMFRHRFYYGPAKRLRVFRPRMSFPPVSCWFDLLFSVVNRLQPVPLPPPR